MSKSLLSALVILSATLFPASMSSAAPPAVEGKSLFGAWRNTDPQSRSYVRILFGEKAGQVYMDCWDRAGRQSKQIRICPRVYIPLSLAETAAKRNFSVTSEHGFVTIDYTITWDENKVRVEQKHTYSDPGRKGLEADATYEREREADAPKVEGLLGEWRKVEEIGHVLIYEDGGKVYLSCWGPPRELPISPAQAAVGEGTPVTIEVKPKISPETLTITLKDNILTLENGYPNAHGRISTAQYQPAY